MTHVTLWDALKILGASLFGIGLCGFLLLVIHVGANKRSPENRRWDALQRANEARLRSRVGRRA